MECAAPWLTRGTGLYLAKNGIRALEVLGLADAVLAQAVCMSHRGILDHTTTAGSANQLSMAQPAVRAVRKTFADAR